MTPVDPLAEYGDGWEYLVIAKNQPQYENLPAMINADGVVCTEWEPTEEEMQRLVCGGRLRIMVHTFGMPLQPLNVDILEPLTAADES